MWTLTQTDDTLWYHVYKNQREGGDRKRRAGISVQEEDKATKRFKGVVKKEEEEPLAVSSAQNGDVEEEILRGYFQLDVKLGDLYKEWGAADSHFKHIADIFTGQCVCLCLLTQHIVIQMCFVVLSMLSKMFFFFSRCANAASGPN